MNFIKRKKSREIILQVIYSWKILKSKNIYCKIKETQSLLKNFNKNSVDFTFIINLVKGIIKHKKYINLIIKKYTYKKVRYLGKIEKIILSIAIYEFKKNKNTPYKVIINESIELTKKFCNVNSYKLINSIINTIYISEYKINHDK